MRTKSRCIQQWPLRPETGPEAATPKAAIRYHAVAMELAAYLDEQYVEMRILTDAGRTITVVCDKASIFSLQRHIEQIGRECPEISTWKPLEKIDGLYGSDRSAYEAAMWEGWPVICA